MLPDLRVRRSLLPLLSSSLSLLFLSLSLTSASVSLWLNHDFVILSHILSRRNFQICRTRIHIPQSCFRIRNYIFWWCGQIFRKFVVLVVVVVNVGLVLLCGTIGLVAFSFFSWDFQSACMGEGESGAAEAGEEMVGSSALAFEI